ncbi:MAG: PE domain-containing protein [Pseudonocardia sp.]
MTDHDAGPARPYGSPEQRWEQARAEIARGGATGGGSGGFLVDPERAEVAIAQLDAALLDIRQAMGRFRHQNVVEPPGQDPVSVNLAEQMREMDRRAGQYVQAWAGQVELFRDAVQAQVDSYRRVDADNAGRLA